MPSMNPRFTYNDEQLEAVSPEERREYIDSVLGIAGGKHHDESRADEYDNWQFGHMHHLPTAKHLLRQTKHLEPHHIEHVKKQGSAEHRLAMLYNEHVAPEHHNEMFNNFVDSENGYDKDDLVSHLREENSENMYDGDWDHLRDAAEEEVRNNYDVDQYIRDHDIKIHEDSDVEEALSEHDWTHENPDFNEDEEESEDNPKRIDYSDHQDYTIEDHPDFEDRHERAVKTAERKAWDDGIPDHVYDGYYESISDDVGRLFREKYDEESDGFHEDYNYLPDHLHGKLDYVNNIEEHKKKKEEKKRLELEAQQAKTMDGHALNRPRTHEYGKGQHHLEMMKAFADANGGSIDTGRMNKVYPGLKDVWHSHFGGNGKLSSEQIQQKIDALPKTKYNISYGLWDKHQAQNVNSQQQMVVRLDHTEDSYNAIKSKSENHAKLFDKLQQASRMSGHPSNPDTIGWARMDLNDKEHHFLDEMQTDFSKAARNQLEAAGQTEHLDTIKDIEDNHSIWREALMNFVTKFSRQNGAKKLSTHSPESKAQHTGSETVHSVYKEAYKQAPRALGFKPAPRDELPLNDEGKGNFISKVAGHHWDHEEGYRHHANIARTLRDPLHNDEFGIGAFDQTRINLANTHEAIAKKHAEKYKEIKPGSLPSNPAAAHPTSNWLDQASESIKSGKAVAHPADKHLDKKQQTFDGHSLDLTPAFALQKTAAWFPDFDDLIKVEDEDKSSINSMNSVVNALQGKQAEEAAEHAKTIEAYEKSDGVMPNWLLRDIVHNKHLNSQQLGRLVDYLHSDKAKPLRDNQMYSYDHIINHPSLTKEHVDKILKFSDPQEPNWMAKKIAKEVALGNKDVVPKVDISKHADHLFNAVEGDYQPELTKEVLPHLSEKTIGNHVLASQKKKNFYNTERDTLEILSPRLKESHIRQMYAAEHSWPRTIAVGHHKLPKDIKDEIISNGVPEAEYGPSHDVDANFARNPSLTSDELKRYVQPIIGKKDEGESNIFSRQQIYGMTQALSHPNMDKNHVKDLLSDPNNRLIAQRIADDPKASTPEYSDQIINTFAGTKGSSDPVNALLYRNGAKPEWFDQIFAQRGGKNLPQNFYTSKHTPKHHLDRLLSNKKPDQQEQLNMIRALDRSPHVNEDHIKNIMELDQHEHPELVEKAVDLSRHHGLYEDKDKVRFAFGTTKLRDARAMAEAHPERKIHKKDLEKAGLNPQALGISHLQDAKGHITHEALSSHIASQPHHEYGYSHAEYGEDNTDDDGEYGDPYESSLEGQQHNLEPSKVFQLNLTKDHFKKMKEQGVFNVFKDMHQASYASGHPGAEGNGLGWVRYTSQPDGHFIDEIQSDFGQSFAKQAVTQLQAKVERGEMLQPEANQHIENFKRRWPEDSYNKIRKIVFGDKEPHEVLHEAFHQHLRDSGHAGKPVHIWHEDGKAPISKMSSRKEANPVWMKQTYNQHPKKMGYKPAKYGDLKTQDNPGLQGEPTLAHTLKKARKVLNTLNKTLGKEK